MIRIVLACLATAALLALPAASLAQDAGSQQYQDPLAGDTDNSGNSGSSGGNGGGTGNGSPNTGNAQAQTDTGTQSAGESDGLPRTGLDAWLLLLAGGVLLGGGLALRRVADRTHA